MAIITSIDQLDMSKEYSYADYLKWQIDERLELFKGFVSRMSAPNVFHQRISRRLSSEIESYFASSSCEMFSAPFDVRLTRKNKITNLEAKTVVQPDICVVCDSRKLDTKGCVGAPDWIIEILSPGNSKREMKDKFEMYQENGVKEYWIVQPADKTVFRYVLNEKDIYIGLQPLTEDDEAIPSMFPDLKINLQYVFEQK
jgi:Uma2 family endonuclease